MKQFEQRVNFQGSAQSQGFSPVNAPDVTPLLRENMQTQQRSMDNMRQARLQEMELNKLTNLAQFSETLSNSLIEQVKQKNERDMEEGLQLFYTQGMTTDVMSAFEAEEKRLQDTHDGIQQVADKAQESGAPFEGVQQLRNLSGWKRYGYSVGFAQHTGATYFSAMEQALKDLPADANSADKAAALATARAQYMREVGILGLNPALLNKYAFPAMRDADTAFLNRWRKEDVVRAQDQLADEATSLFQADPVNNFSTSISDLVRSGKYSRGDARKYLLSMINNSETIDAIGQSMSWDGQTTWEKKYSIEFEEARRRAVKSEIDAYETDKAAMSLEGKQWFDKVQDLWEQNPPSEREIEEAKRFMSDEYDYIDSRLERWTSRSTDAEAKTYWTDQLEKMDRAGVLTEGILSNPSIPYDVVTSFRSRAQQLDKARAATPEFKQYTAQLKDDIKSFATDNALMKSKPGTELAIAQAQADYNRIFNQQIRGGASPEEAARNAYALVKQQIDQGQNGVGRYTFDSTEGFTKIIPKGISTGWDKHKQSVDQLLTTNKASALDRNSLIPRSLLEAAVRESSSPNYTPPAIAQYISDRLGGQITPWEVLNRQAKAQGVGQLAVPPALQAAQESMSPEFLRLLSYRSSRNRADRAFISTGSFNPNLIPNGYGSVILQAAQQHGVDPGLLAGIIEVESRFNPNARSGAGAVGIAQIMPKYHPGVDPTNPRESILYAAKYLRSLEKQLGSIEEAIYAYNGGPGGIRKSAENRAYLPKVLKAAAKYGYGADRGWSSPALLNPRVAYITGNIGPTSTGPHLDIKKVGGGRFSEDALDRYVVINDPQFGQVTPGQLRKKLPGRGDNFDQHVARGSHGIDYPTAEGSRVYLRGGAKVVGSKPTAHGDMLTIQLPNGQQYTFLHGKKA